MGLFNKADKYCEQVSLLLLNYLLFVWRYKLLQPNGKYKFSHIHQIKALIKKYLMVCNLKCTTEKNWPIM